VTKDDARQREGLVEIVAAAIEATDGPPGVGVGDLWRAYRHETRQLCRERAVRFLALVGERVMTMRHGAPHSLPDGRMVSTYEVVQAGGPGGSLRDFASGELREMLMLRDLPEILQEVVQP
jgi:hypothetical protein